MTGKVRNSECGMRETVAPDSAFRIPHSALLVNNTPMWPDAEKTQDLLAEAKGGDAAAVNRLMDRHRDSLRRMVQLRLDQRIQQRIDVSDIVQDVLVEANRRLKKYLAKPLMPYPLWLPPIAPDRTIHHHPRPR